MQIIRLTTSCLHFAVLCQFSFLSLLCTWINQTDLLASVNFAVWKDCHSLAGQPKLNYISKVNKTFIDNIYATIVLVIAQPYAFELWTPRFFLNLMPTQSRRYLFKSRGACSNRLSIFLSVLFSEPSNSGSAQAPLAPLLSTALHCIVYFILPNMVHVPKFLGEANGRS